MLEISQLLVLSFFVALGYGVYHGCQGDPREPPAVSSEIPVIGHLLGMLRYGFEYFGLQTADQTDSKKHPNYPIFSLNMLFSKAYVITSPALLQAAQRNNKFLSFDPFLMTSTERIAGVHSRKVLKLLRGKQSGGDGIAGEIMHAMTPTLFGTALDRMNERMVELLPPFVDELGDAPTLDLYSWCQHAITVASTDATYGPLNPYKDKVVEDAFWDFESNLTPLLVNILPWLTARKAWESRKTMISAILKYYQNNGPDTGSELASVRYRRTRDAGIGIEDTARLETPMAIALLSNTVPATFWTLFDLYSRPQLLHDIRKEIELNALHVATDGTHIIHLADLRDKCPLLVSAFQEILRTRTTSSPMRCVMKDILLADQYLIKAGTLLNMPSEAMSRNQDVWGSTAAEFDPRRYMKPVESVEHPEDRKKDPRRVGGFMAFGVSPIICPGRHFASNEILGLAAMIALRYDISPESGVWTPPQRNSMAIVSIMGPLKEGFKVNVKRRKEFEEKRWEFQPQEGKGRFPLMIG
ncbi:cytochrome P450 [Penicillium alfredii]|uniref:Cytochrome P450 n=1 Tax=Penicillium alfredii TaxID=1506179 RepID=A0A9W9GAD3_9EURO|nr:cytochrome P450 [Penicillium alfredii]KAJ5115091.1 cytochrome P450 [Penicillium alfredii]